jgi:hypothetical protein
MFSLLLDVSVCRGVRLDASCIGDHQTHGYCQSVRNDSPARKEPLTQTGWSINPPMISAGGRLPGASSAPTAPSPDRVPDRVPAPSTQPPHELLRSFGRLPGLTDRDSSIVVFAVLLRVVGYDQLRRLLFKGRDVAAIRHRARELEVSEWLHRWNAPVPFIGRIGHLHPAPRALQHVMQMALAASGEARWSRLIEQMIPRTGRRPLDLGTAPKWLSHQREVNHLVTSTLIARAPDILWASTWDCPFPQKNRGVVMPQPDYVLVERAEHEPIVVFGEHDRGNEPLARFVERKVALYSKLAGVAEDVIGVPRFRVDVSVIDVQSHNPIARLGQLRDATNAYGAADLFRFTLGGWLYAYPNEAIWFARAPETQSVAWRNHEGLVASEQSGHSADLRS